MRQFWALLPRGFKQDQKWANYGHGQHGQNNLQETPLPGKNEDFTNFKTEADKFMAGVFSHLEEYGRAGDFLSILKHMSEGTLPCSNLCLHLLLDIGGKFLSNLCIKNMRYSIGKDHTPITEYC